MAFVRPTAMDHPLGWQQPDLPPLPEGEAQRESVMEVWGGKARHPPSAAPGFLAAWQLGLLPPPPPPVAPSPVPGMNASQWLKSALAAVVGVTAIVIALPDDAPAALVLLIMVTGIVAAGWCFLQTFRREKVEFRAGYTTRSVFTGLWRLGRGGRVRREPDRNVPPPGWYPSPYFPGLLQRWEGPGWKPLAQHWYRRPQHYFRQPDQPFLDHYRP